MAKKIQRTMRRRGDTIVTPSSDNAKWVGIGFLTAVFVVILVLAMLIQAKGS